jgi:hypothetical protein
VRGFWYLSSPSGHRFVALGPAGQKLTPTKASVRVRRFSPSIGRAAPRRFWLRFSKILNRTQLLVVGFLALVWIALVAILVFAPEVYTQTLRRVGAGSGGIEASFLIVLSALIVFLVVGVFRRWRWTFWLVLVAFFFGVLRLPASALQLAGTIPASGPTWYEALQGVIGAVQFLIAIAMFAGYRKAGVWGDF